MLSWWVVLALAGCSASHVPAADSALTADGGAMGDAGDGSEMCPRPIPRDGTACVHENPMHGHPQCVYMDACGSTLATCSGGHWGVSSCRAR